MIKTNRKAQCMKSKISPASPFRKKAQEEMVGFALILIIVAVIFLVFLSVYIRKPPEISENSEVNSFIQASLQYTTNCEQDSKNLTLQKLVYKCQNEEICSDGKKTCKALNDTLKGIIEESWQVGEKNPVKGYTLLIFSEKEQILNLTKGVVTKHYKGSPPQDIPPTSGDREELITITFNAYS
jgi:hypothetical protein